MHARQTYALLTLLCGLFLVLDHAAFTTSLLSRFKSPTIAASCSAIRLPTSPNVCVAFSAAAAASRASRVLHSPTVSSKAYRFSSAVVFVAVALKERSGPVLPRLRAKLMPSTTSAPSSAQKARCGSVSVPCTFLL